MAGSDMFANLSALLQAVEQGNIKEEPKRKKKLKKKKKVKKAKEEGVTSDVTAGGERSRSASPSPMQRQFSPLTRPPATTPMSPSARRPYSAGAPYSGVVPPQAGTRYRTASPSELRICSSSVSPSSPIARPSSAMPLRPHSACTTMHYPPKEYAGPTVSERTAPKYTATSRKHPELGTEPGSYQAPPWRPVTGSEQDPLRQELPAPLAEGRFKRVLAVPAHVLAKSFFHPDAPSAQTRVKQLQEDLRIARMDRKLIYTEKVAVEKALRQSEEVRAWAEEQAGALSAENESLREQLSAMARCNKGLKQERDALEEQIRGMKVASRDLEVAELKRTLAAAQLDMEDLRAELKRALQLAAS